MFRYNIFTSEIRYLQCKTAIVASRGSSTWLTILVSSLDIVSVSKSKTFVFFLSRCKKADEEAISNLASKATYDSDSAHETSKIVFFYTRL